MSPFTFRVPCRWLDGDHFQSLPCELSFDPADPYAVMMTATDGGGPEVWALSRDLLADGSAATFVGMADVRVRSVRMFGSDWRQVYLASPDGEVDLYLDEATVEAFLAATFRRVPRGGESAVVDARWDAELALLLGGAR